jgi:tetratricopeptide (TPR) repeat protein
MADGPREKLENARIIRKEADLILSLDPNYAPAYYILGKWHHALASLNGVERMFCNMFFGGVPEGASMDEAVRCYEKAIQLRPDYILFHYSKAMSLHWLGEHKKSAVVLEKALTLSPQDLEDPVRLQKCRKLLAQVKSPNL